MDSFLTLQAGVEVPAMDIINASEQQIATPSELFAVLKGIGVFCQVRPDGMALPIGLFKVIEKDDLMNYKQGFNLLMQYFDSISDEEQPKVDAKLKALGL